jgi:hypothetical protein
MLHVNVQIIQTREFNTGINMNIMDIETEDVGFTKQVKSWSVRESGFC